MRSDTNTKGHTHWYYFKVKNMKKGQTVKFNICNFTKKKCLYLRVFNLLAKNVFINLII